MLAGSDPCEWVLRGIELVEPVVDTPETELDAPFLVEPLTDLLGPSESCFSELLLELVDVVRLKGWVSCLGSAFEECLDASPSEVSELSLQGGMASSEEVGNLLGAQVCFLSHLDGEQALILTGILGLFECLLDIGGLGWTVKISGSGHGIYLLVWIGITQIVYDMRYPH